MEWYELTALQLGEKIRAGEVSAVEAAQAALDHAFARLGPAAQVLVMPYGGSTLPRVAEE